MTRIIIQNFKKSSVVKNDLDPNDWWYNPVQFLLIVITNQISIYQSSYKLVLTKIIGDYQTSSKFVKISITKHHKRSNLIKSISRSAVVKNDLDPNDWWAMCVTLLCIHVPTSTSIIITIITINICLLSNTIFQFSSPRFCPFWLRNMYKMSNATTISSACELWLEARSAKYISPPWYKTRPSRTFKWLRIRSSIATEGIY